jgi:RimJ/RimL family protein N-acetyltransferase
VTRGPVLHGEMVRLRPLAARDAARMWESLQDPEGMRLTGTTATLTRAEVQERAAGVADRPGRYDWAVTPGAVRDGRPVSDEMIGEIVLDEVDDVARSASLRLQMLPDYRGRGYGREAILEVLRFAFDGADDADGTAHAGPRLHRVALDVLSINPRARALYASLGFQEEGRLREAHPDGDGWADVVVMSILEDEFRSLAGA